jgi:DNA-binding PadR family transcriptional regulator
LINNLTSKNKSVKKQSLLDSLDRLQKDGTIISRTIGNSKNVLFVDWEKAKKEGYIKEI